MPQRAACVAVRPIPLHARNVVVECREKNQQLSPHVRFSTAPPIGVGVELCVSDTPVGQRYRNVTDSDRNVVQQARVKEEIQPVQRKYIYS